VLSSGTLEYFNGAFLHQINFLPGAILEIGSGNIANGLIVDNGLTVEVASGGTASGAAIGSGGTERVRSGALDSAATITSDGVAFISSGGVASADVVSSGGILAVSSGGTAVSATIGDGGLEGVLVGAHDSATRIVSGGTMFVYSGGIASAAVISGGTMELLVGGSAGGAITFAGAAGTLQINDITMPANTISGFLPGDTFYLSGIPFDSGGSADLLTGNVLQITEGGQEYDLQLDPSQDFSGKFFHLNPVSSGGTLVTEDNTPCYCAGTRILTDRGEADVETLAIGDNVITASGAVRPIRWIGKRSYAGRFARGSHVLPICIKAGTLDVDQPQRDLWISPQHAMLLEGVLIEAIDLINGVSIVQSDRVERVDYFHIELDSHDIIIAEGAWSESFVDDDSRAIFQNAPEFAALYPNTPAVRPARYCAPRRAFGAEVETARQRIAQRARIPYTRPATARGPRALVIDSCIPQLGHDGGANAILDHIRALQAAGFEVSLLALGGDCRDASALSSLGLTPLSVPRSGRFSDFVQAHAGQFALIYLHRAETATRCLKLARRYFDAQIIYSVADLHHLRLQAQSKFASGHASELMHEARDVALQELFAALSADRVITHSVSEAEQLDQLPSIAATGKVRVIPWVVPIAPVQTRFSDRSGLAFIGSFKHAPNVDAARWLVSEIMPLVWRKAPEVQCLIGGSDLSEELRCELARPGVDVLGRVDRLGDVFEQIRCTVAPLRFGAGLKDKVLRSMAAGLPCVGTPEAFRGMHALPAEITNTCQGETAPELAAALVRVLRDERGNANSAQIGLTYIAAFYNQPRIDQLMREISHSALAHHRAKGRPNSDCKVLDFAAVPCRAETELAASSSRSERRIIFK
jgi:autotransporter passenger strand-loop-strand repeat protein